MSDLHRQAPEINLFELAPAHTFASLTARAAIGLAIFIIFSGLADTSEITDIDLVVYIVIGTLAAVVFVLPLNGMRQRLGDEKARLLGKTNERIQVTIGRIHNHVDSNSSEREGISGLNTTMSALVTERDLIVGISTWSRESSTLRGFATTLLLPIFLWLVTRLLERLILISPVAQAQAGQGAANAHLAKLKCLQPILAGRVTERLEPSPHQPRQGLAWYL